jgi:hypothetical protein
MRRLQMLLAVAVFMFMAHWMTLGARANDAPGVKVEISTEQAKPREVEDSTQKAIVRDYTAAWSAMEASLESNQDAGLAAQFSGNALGQLQDRLQAQKKNGLRTRFTDRGHKLSAIFYSPEGSAMELHDTAQLEIETLDGSKVLRSEPVTLHYVALMTTAEDRWKVRVLQGVPDF